MDVIRARTAGFCMGVGLALQKLERAISEHTRLRIATLGPIIHNPQVLRAYEARGVRCLSSLEGVGKEDCIVIRAHGIPRDAEDALRATGACIVDATCPKVKKAQLAIAKATRSGAELLLFGEANHPEVRGLVSYAMHGARVFGSLEELRALALEPAASYVLASQTTQERSIFDEVERHVLGLCPGTPVLSTICDATRDRQAEARSLASRVDVMVIVGGRESGNTRRLADVAAAGGVPTWHVETCDELRAEDFRGRRIAGLTAGASTPRELIDAAADWLARQ
ncbi:MAG: 4-hydroxy-3-methylbut-2-enyl diphosphate reductase [Desulfovibrionaceae bacterium]|nr:4-hydroxy-3-methylbut-2-enyl diphosphate reductase [Desulfovibrionaceae bacterium]